MNTQVSQEQLALQKLRRFIEAGGPEESEYNELTSIWNSLQLEGSAPDLLMREDIVRLFGDEFLSQTMQGFTYRKPHGYSGDFEIIDNIYEGRLNRDKRFQKWDKYYYAHQACKAVRNRKRYFIKLVKEKASRINRPLRILNIASGPCRDVLELLEQVPIERLKIHCVEMDPKAISYAKELLGPSSNAIQFTQKNIFKFDTDDKFDLIWSAGLFDYFENDVFISLLSRIYEWCIPTGEIVLGNFSVFNPSRSYMEKALGWYLFYRTEDELTEIALKAGLDNDQVEIKSEELGINLFLHISV